jgi:hypothetical protein
MDLAAISSNTSEDPGKPTIHRGEPLNKNALRALVSFIAVTSFLFGQTKTPGTTEQLQQLTTRLQQSPGDTALREKIIRLAQEIKPAPMTPDEAIKFEGRGQFAFKNARSPKDYLAAANEYEQALTIAPWVGGYYSDLCTIYEKAGIYIEAKKDCESFLIGMQSQTESADIKRRIAGLDFAIDKYSKRSLESDFSSPFDRTPQAAFPPGTRYFCDAFTWDHANVLQPRFEYWVVLSGTTVTGATLEYFTPEWMENSLKGWLDGYRVLSSCPNCGMNRGLEHYPENPNLTVLNTQVLNNRHYEIDLEHGYVLDQPGTASHYFMIANDGTKVTRVQEGIVQDQATNCVRQ